VQELFDLDMIGVYDQRCNFDAMSEFRSLKARRNRSVTHLFSFVEV